ncbi:hypothetical protein [Streptomyces sp. AcE210]|uniref:hypothetical protein n=1 Tax=Streptomyces sp. AcE210 TaxID=2292703 RepID=UPI000E30759A|nr:hypothetical protein [Streptomyces sp. AcE210]RFC78251.1 hypothetical protein DXZ75_11185 [Streptomyces sp. AcE210]
MRSVYVFPAGESTATAARLDRLMPGKDGYWSDGKLFIDFMDEQDDHLFVGWTPEDVRLLDSALGHRPTWALLVSVSSHIDGTAEIRALLSHVLEAGGVGVDDYSDHCWTLEEIDTECKVDGLGFFDFRTHGERQGKQTWTFARASPESQV